MDLNVDKGEGPSSSRSTLRDAPLSRTTPTSTHPLVADEESYDLYVAAAQQLDPTSQQLEPAPPLALFSIDDNGPTDEIQIDKSSDPSATLSPGATSGSSATPSSGLAIATTLSWLPYEAAPQARRTPQSSQAEVPAPQPAVGGNAQEEALRVRSNILRGMWQSLSRLWKPRLFFFLARMALNIIQIVASLVIVALPSSLGNSPSGGDIDGSPPAPGSQCDPEPIFVYLVLHVTRLVVLLPLDIYLTLSPHGNARQRRPGARNFAERERNRTFGSLERDRKVAKLVDLLSLGYCVLFVVGNWAVWSRTECSHRPADSFPLFYTALAMLCLTYLYIMVILIIAILVVFFLPLFLVILRALGITRRPQEDIKPETAKVEKDEVEKVTKLVYYVDEDEWLRVVRDSRQERSSLEQLMPVSACTSESEFLARINTQVASKVPLPTSPALLAVVEDDEPVFLVHALPGTTVSNSTEKSGTATSTAPTAEHSTKAGSARPRRSRARLDQMLLFGRQRRRHNARTRATAAADKTTSASSSAGSSSASTQATKPKSADASHEAILTTTNATAATGTTAAADRRLRYPLYPLPAHRSTCPICLCDFESPLQQGPDSTANATPSLKADFEPTAESESEPEPLRLLPCQHVLHASCIDQWLTTVSGRCPICQRAVLKSGDQEEGEEQGGQGEVEQREGAGGQGEGL